MARINHRLILYSVAWCSLFLAAYAAVIQLTLPDITASPTTSLANRLFVERYVYGHPAANVLVGSSLTRRLPMAVLGPDFTNLALDGEGVLTGLAIAAASPSTPKRVYMEINQIGMGSDASLLHATFSEPMFTLRRNVAALRKTYQAGNVFYALMRGHGDKPDTPGSRTMTADQRQDVIAANSRSLQTQWSDKKLGSALNDTRKMVDLFKQRGIEPVFYEMPIEPELRGFPQPLQVREAFRKKFPATKYCWITVLPQRTETLDGLHLADAGAAEAAEIFRKNPPCER